MSHTHKDTHLFLAEKLGKNTRYCETHSDYLLKNTPKTNKNKTSIMK